MLFLSKALIHFAAITPLAWLYYGAFNDTIGADPVERVIHFTGIGALNILMISLLISPVAKKFKKPVLIKFRRMLGLWAFTYAALHLLNFIAFDLQFNLSLFISEVIERPYITLGMAAFLVLLLLAVTSFSKLKRKMGKSWQKLHNWVYIGVVAVWVHFYWSIKSDIIEPAIYAALIICLLSFRISTFKRWWYRNR